MSQATRIHIICEGQTEETFVKELLKPYLEKLNIELYPSLIGKTGHKGGNVNFDRLLTDVRNRLLGDPTAYCTTFFDFYALPTDFPGKASAAKKATVKAKAACVENELKEAVEKRLGSKPLQRFIPYVQMYEFEALLFSDPKRFAKGLFNPTLEADFQAIRDLFGTPEDINDSPVTAPSKRVENLVPHYEKPTYGALAALEVGLSVMRRECVLFNEWIQKLETL